MKQPSFHLELRTSRGKYLTDLAVADAEHAVHAMRHLAEVSPTTYGPYGSHRLVLTGPDHAVMPRLVETVGGAL